MGIVIPFIWDVLTKIKYFHSKFLLLSVKSCLAHIWVEKQLFREGVGGAEVVTIIVAMTLWKCCISAVSGSIAVRNRRWVTLHLICPNTLPWPCKPDCL